MIFGDSVAVSGSTVVVGTFAHASGAPGAYLFIKRPTGWATAPTWPARAPLATTNSQFGRRVGTTIAVGAYGHDSGVGSVYVFEG